MSSHNLCFHAMYIYCFKKEACFQIGVHDKKIFFSFLNENICCGYSKKPSRCDGSFEHPKYMKKLMSKKMFTILRSKILFTYEPGLR